MIQVELKDFENYKSQLLRYANALLMSKGSANTPYDEYNELAKDIVQETYLAFHTSNLNAFVSDTHLFSYLKTCLYRKYQEATDAGKHKRPKMSSKSDSIYLVGEDLPEFEYTQEFFSNSLSELSKTLTETQKDVLDKLIAGWSQAEISKTRKVSPQAITRQMEGLKSKYLKHINE